VKLDPSQQIVKKAEYEELTNTKANLEAKVEKLQQDLDTKTADLDTKEEELYNINIKIKKVTNEME